MNALLTYLDNVLLMTRALKLALAAEFLSPSMAVVVDQISALGFLLTFEALSYTPGPQKLQWENHFFRPYRVFGSREGRMTSVI